MNAQNSGPAFPTKYPRPNDGMTLRDYFAAKAMAALIQSSLLGDDGDIAGAAYEIADSMLEAREAGK